MSNQWFACVNLLNPYKFAKQNLTTSKREDLKCPAFIEFVLRLWFSIFEDLRIAKLRKIFPSLCHVFCRSLCPKFRGKKAWKYSLAPEAPILSLSTWDGSPTTNKNPPNLEVIHTNEKHLKLKHVKPLFWKKSRVKMRKPRILSRHLNGNK